MIDGKGEIVMYDETIQTNGEQIRKTNETPSPFAAGMLYLTVLLLMLLSSLLTARINTQVTVITITCFSCSWQQ